MENLAEENIWAITTTIEAKKKELRECGMFNLVDKHMLRKEIRELETMLKPLVRQANTQRQ